jgi:methyl-accepting chemotaxis protein
MALPPDYSAGLKIYGIPQGDEGLRLRRRIWTYLSPCLSDFFDAHLDASTEHALVFSEALTGHRDIYKNMLLNYYRALLTQPLDEPLLAVLKDRVKVESDLGYDMRARGAVAQTVISAVHTCLLRDRWLSKRTALRLTDLAARLMTWEAAIGDALHFQARAREAKNNVTTLREAVDEFNTTMEGIRSGTTKAVSAMGGTATELAQLAKSGADRAEAAARAADDNASNASRMASATEELFASINNIRDQTTLSARMAYDAVDHAGRTNGTIVSLSQAVDKIGSVVGLISEIASSTNMLSLNATIEASRAGEAGRGFAVVASEVKALATQTSQATQEIGKQIAMIQAATRHSVAQIGENTRAIEGIAKIAETVASSIDQQAGVTGSIAEGVSGAARAATTIAEALRIIEDTVRLTRDASNAALDLSERLSTSDKKSGVAMDALFQAAAKHEGLMQMTRLHRRGA